MLQIIIYLTNLSLPIDCSNEPWESQSQKHIHRITSSYISNGIIGRLFCKRSLFTRKQIRQAGSKSNKCYSGNFIFKFDETAKDASQVSNNECEQTNHAKSHKEGQPATPYTHWGY